MVIIGDWLINIQMLTRVRLLVAGSAFRFVERSGLSAKPAGIPDYSSQSAVKSARKVRRIGTRRHTRPMASVTSAPTDDGPGESGVAQVDPRAPRFGQALTTAGLVGGIVLQVPALVYAVAVVLNAAVISGWRLDLYGVLWQRAVRPVAGPPAEKEPAAPHRFARLMGAVFTALASGLLLAGPASVGYAIAGMVAGLAGLAAALDFCVGCAMYRQVSFFRRLDVV